MASKYVIFKNFKKIYFKVIVRHYIYPHLPTKPDKASIAFVEWLISSNNFKEFTGKLVLTECYSMVQIAQ